MSETWDNYEEYMEKSDSDAWEKFKDKHIVKGAIISDKVFIDYKLSGYDFSFITFKDCKFVSCDLSDSFMVGAIFTDCEFVEGTDLSGAKFGRVNNPPNTRELGKCSFYRCDMSNIYAPQITIEHTSFEECNLTGTDFSKCSFSQNVEFLNSNISGCNFSESCIHKAGWSKCIVDEKTNFYKVDFISSYPFVNDGSDTIKFRTLDKIMNWENVRFFSAIPVFGIAWLSFVFTILLINFISYLNDTRLIETLNYPVTVPSQAGVIILSSVLLGMSATIYKFLCPNKIQSFTQDEWVYEHKHSRPIYLVYLLQSKKWIMLSVVSMFAGGLLALWLVGTRLFSAINYIFSL